MSLIPEDIPAVAVVVDQSGHVTMHLLPNTQGRSLRQLLDVPAWDSEGADVADLLEALGQLVARRKEIADG